MASAISQLPNVYFYVWKKKITDVSQPVDVKIPSTIVYEYDFPKSWFVYSKAKEEVIRRVGKELDSASIYNDFVKKGTSEEEVVAQWMTPTQGGEITAEFFNKQTLHDFLTKRKKRGHGVLQKFVPPAGANVATIQAIWTPHLVLVEKRQNTQQLDDNRLDMGPRCITYEGPLHISRPSFVAPHIESKVRDVCNQLTAHIADVEHSQLAQMSLYFRASKNGDLWLLWCSQLQVAGGQSMTPRMAGTQVEGELPPIPDSSSLLKDLRTAVDEDLRKLDEDGKLPTMGPIGDTYTQCYNWTLRREREGLTQSPSPRSPSPNSPDGARTPLPPSDSPPGTTSRFRQSREKQGVLEQGKAQRQNALSPSSNPNTDPIWLRVPIAGEEALKQQPAPRSRNAPRKTPGGSNRPSVSQGLTPRPPDKADRSGSAVTATPSQDELNQLEEKIQSDPGLADLVKRLNDFVEYLGYHVYSHFLCSRKGFLFNMYPELEPLLGQKLLRDFGDLGLKQQPDGEYLWMKPKGILSAIPHQLDAWVPDAKFHLASVYDPSDAAKVQKAPAGEEAAATQPAAAEA